MGTSGRSGTPGTDGPRERAGAEAEVAAVLAKVWARRRDGVLEQVGLLETAAAGLAGGTLPEADRAAAAAAAHRLAGSLGMFGLVDGSARAREAELLLGGTSLAPADAPALERLAAALRAQVEATAQLGEAPPPADPPAEDAPLLLVVEDDEALAEAVVVEAQRRGMRVELAGSAQQALAAIARERPDAVVLDLVLGDGTAGAYALLSELETRLPAVPVLVSTVRDELADRVEVARRGGRGFLTKERTPGEVVEHVTRLLERSRTSGITLLYLDDDPAMLDAVRELLAHEGLRVVTLEDPQRLWDELERVQPDLVLLDVEMPHVNGIELCRVLRNDPQWATVPVVVLTALRDHETIERIFAAGADDYLAKPIVEAELRVRVRNRIERLALHRALAEVDSLTSVANRHTAIQSIERLLLLAARQHQPLALAMLDLDHFKLVNDRHGHAAGDAVLRRLGTLLRQTLRGEDVVGRWVGEEFVIAMFGTTGADARARLAHLRAAFERESFGGAGGETFGVGFSAGVACFADDGRDLATLLAAADEALYRAKDAGRGHVLLAGETP